VGTAHEHARRAQHGAPPEARSTTRRTSAFARLRDSGTTLAFASAGAFGGTSCSVSGGCSVCQFDLASARQWRGPSGRSVAEWSVGVSPAVASEAIVSSDDRRRVKGAAPAVQGALSDHAYTGHRRARWLLRPAIRRPIRPAPTVGRALAAPRSSASTDQLDTGDDADSAPRSRDARDWRFGANTNVEGGWM
jgi:hypothetical protein